MALPDRHTPQSTDRSAADPLRFLTEAALAHGDILSVLPDVLSCVRQILAADFSAVLLAGEAQRALTVQATSGLTKSRLRPGLRLPLEPEVVSLLVEMRLPLTLEPFSSLKSNPGLHVIGDFLRDAAPDHLVAPLVVDSRLLGIVLAVPGQARRFTLEDATHLQEIADRVALALDHARLYRSERIARSDAVRAERRFRDLVHNLDAIVWEADISGWQYTFVSRRAEKILGYPLEQWLNTPDFWMQIVHPDDRAAVARHRGAAVEKGRGGSFEYRVIAADGRVLWMQGLTDVVRDLAGVPRKMRGLLIDNSQRRHAEEDAQRLAAIVESSDDAIIGKDLDGIIQSWNDGAQKIYGYTQAEAIGQHITLLTPPHLRRQVNEIMRKLRAGERITQLQTQRRRRDGEIIEVALTISPIYDRTGNRIVGASTIAREITDLKRAERTLRTTEKLAATGRLAASIAHEINNPMASVTNLLYLLQHHAGLDATATEYIKLAQEELNRVTHIVRQMLGFYRESEAPVPVDLKDVIDNVLILYARRLKNTRIIVDRKYRTQATIRGFPGEIRQVFSNLIVNSIEAVGDVGHIRIDVRAGRDWSKPDVRGVRIQIADDGPGIPEEARRHIFEPFFTTKGERGTGLGLWVSEGIVRKHGGSIRVRSHTGEHRRGTCFSLFFPLESAGMNRLQF